MMKYTKYNNAKALFHGDVIAADSGGQWFLPDSAKDGIVYYERRPVVYGSCGFIDDVKNTDQK